MKSNHPDENTIREYLLGRLDDQPEVEESMSDKIFFDDELSEMVGAVEDEILDEYLDGGMNPTDMDAVKNYFLRPAERKEKLQFVSLLRRQFKAEGTREVKPRSTPAGPGAGVDAMVLSRSHLRGYLELAAVVVLSMSSWLYVNYVRQGLQSKIAENQKKINQLEEEKRRAASVVEAKLESVHLSLQPNDRRGTDAPHQVTITPATRRIAVELILEDSDPEGLYQVTLKQGERELWSMADTRRTDHPLLVFEVPSQVLKSGRYSFVAFPQAGPNQYQYKFNFEAVTVTK